MDHYSLDDQLRDHRINQEMGKMVRELSRDLDEEFLRGLQAAYRRITQAKDLDEADNLVARLIRCREQQLRYSKEQKP
ncbi:MAG: hypothetical protein AAF125_05690 [Chloroflexota bacterium]